MIETRRLSRRFGGLLAVDRLDIEVKRGECLGFLGPNGAGKTTTVRMLCGLLAPSSGGAVVAGFDVVADAQEVRRRVGLLTETPGMYDRLSARRNLSLFAALHGVSDIDARVQKYLEMLDLWDRRDDPVGSFSKGMRQKLAIGRALIHEPPILFLDEPTSGLDPEAARRIRTLIGELKAAGRTLFVCTHNLTEAEQLCDRVALFRSRLLAVDTPPGLRERTYGREVEIRLQGATDAHVALLQALPFAPEVARSGDRLVVRTRDPDTNNPILIQTLVSAGARVQYVTEIQQSLERIYLEILGNPS